MWDDYRREQCEICGHDYNNRDDVRESNGFEIMREGQYEPEGFSICDECADLHYKVCKIISFRDSDRAEDMSKAVKTILGI